MGLTVEQQVQRFMEDSNRPYNVQLVVDNLQKYGIKKGQVQKALDNLVEKGKVSVKVRHWRLPRGGGGGGSPSNRRSGFFNHDENKLFVAYENSCFVEYEWVRVFY